MAVRWGGDVAGQGDVSQAQAGRGEVEAMWQGDAALMSCEGRVVLVCIRPLLIWRWFFSGAARCNGMPPAIPVYDGKTVGQRVLTTHHRRAPDMHKIRRIWEGRSDGGRAEKKHGV